MVRASRNASNARRAAEASATGATPIRCRVRNEGAVTRVDIFDDIGDYGDGGLSAASFARQLAGVKGALVCHVNSGGGDVWDGVAIHNALADHAGPVTVVVDGLAASIASVIVQGGRERVVNSGSMVMIHDAFGAVVGNAEELTAMAQTLSKVSDNIASIYASRAGGTIARWRSRMRAESWYGAEEAVAAGLADKVGAAPARMPAGVDLSAFSACPERVAARLRAAGPPVRRRPSSAPDDDFSPEMIEAFRDGLIEGLAPLRSAAARELPREWRDLRDQARRLGGEVIR